MDRLRGGEWFSLRKQILERDGYECRNCKSSSNLCVHHIVPVSESGSETKSNLVVLCRECHRTAHGERVRTTPDTKSKQPRRVCSVGEIRNICRTTVHPLHQSVLITLAKTGIGVGELSNLNVEDIDLPFLPCRDWNHTERSFLRVRYGGQIPHSNRRERVATTYVPIDKELTHVMKRWFLVRPDTEGTKPLFCSVSEWGRRITPSMIRNLFEKYDRPKGGLTAQLTPLTLRYFFKERFEGPPLVREYILKGTDTENTLDEIYTAYCDFIYPLLQERL